MVDYRPLRKGEFRLLTILDDSGLTLSLNTHEFEQAPPYIALSYRWGRAPYQKGRPKDRVYCVVVDGREVEIAQNLHDALCHLAKPVRDAACAFWVDAICINQTDLDEKADQVPRMKHFYERSEAVYGWLGVPFDDQENELAVRLMLTFTSYVEQSLSANMGDSRMVINGITPDHIGFPSDTASEVWRAWDGIAEIFTQSYWYRTWVTQELSTPGKIRFYSGPYCFNGGVLQNASLFGLRFSQFPEFNETFRRSTGSTSGVCLAMLVRRRREQGQHQRLLSLLVGLKYTTCMDPRDKVFVAVAHATDVSPGQIVVDYHRDITQVFIDVVRHALSQNDQGGLEFLGQAYMQTSASRNTHQRQVFHPPLPSWVPDWRTKVIIGGIDNRERATAGGAPLYRACPGTSAEARICDMELELKGHVREDLVPEILTDIWDDLDASSAIPRGWYDTLMLNGAVDLDEPIRRSLVGDKTRTDIEAHDNENEVAWKRGGAVDWSLLEASGSVLDQKSLAARTLMDVEMTYSAYLRRMAKMSGGQIAILPAAARPDDQVAAFHGGSSLYLVRSVADRQDAYQLVGECFVDGLMDGAFLDDASDFGKTVRTIRLV